MADTKKIGRPPIDDPKEHITLRLERSKIEKLKNIADENGFSISELLTSAIEGVLEPPKIEKQEKHIKHIIRL